MSSNYLPVGAEAATIDAFEAVGCVLGFAVFVCIRSKLLTSQEDDNSEESALLAGATTEQHHPTEIDGARSCFQLGVLAAFFYSLTGLAAKMAENTYDVPVLFTQVVRSWVGWVLVLTELRLSGASKEAYIGKQWTVQFCGVLLCRVVCGIVAQFLYLWSMQQLPIGNLVSVYMLYPFFTILLTVVLISWDSFKTAYLWVAALSAFGVVLIEQPSGMFGSIEDDQDPRQMPIFGYVGILIGAVFMGGGMVFLQMLPAGEDPRVTVHALAAGNSIVSTCAFLFTNDEHIYAKIGNIPATAWYSLVLTGACLYLAQLCTATGIVASKLTGGGASTFVLTQPLQVVFCYAYQLSFFQGFQVPSSLFALLGAVLCALAATWAKLLVQSSKDGNEGEARGSAESTTESVLSWMFPFMAALPPPLDKLQLCCEMVRCAGSREDIVNTLAHST